MKGSTVVILGTSIVSLGALAIYGKKQFDMISNDLEYGYDRSSIKFTSASINRVSMNINLTVENKGDLSLQAKDLKVDITTEGLTLTEIRKTGEFTIAPHVKTPLPIDLFFNPEQIIRSRKDLNIANWKSIPLTFKGSIKVRKIGVWFTIPFKFTYKISELM